MSDEDLIRYARMVYGKRFAETVAFAFVRGGGFAQHVRGSLLREIARREYEAASPALRRLDGCA